MEFFEDIFLNNLETRHFSSTIQNGRDSLDKEERGMVEINSINSINRTRRKSEPSRWRLT